MRFLRLIFGLSLIVPVIALNLAIAKAQLPDCSVDHCLFLPFVARVSSAPTPTVQIQATATSTHTPTTTATPTPQPGQLRIRSQRSFVRTTTRYVVGEIINETASPAYYVKVTGRFYNAANQLVATEETYAILDQTAPGQRNPFKLLLTNAPTDIVRYELSLSWQTSSFLDFRALAILSQYTRTNFGLEVFGEIQNNQSRDINGIEMAVTFYDAAGEVVDVDSGFATSLRLGVGATAAYSIKTFDTGPTYNNLVVNAQGYLALVTPTPISQPQAGEIYIRSQRNLRQGPSLSVIGEVLNSWTAPVYFVKVVGKFYNAANELVAVSDTYTFLTQTRSGQRNPFELLVSNAPTGITRSELSLVWELNSSLEFVPLTVVSQQTRDNFGVEVFGEVRNDHPRSVQTARIAVSFYNANGDVVGVDLGFPSQTSLAPGAISAYSIKTFDTSLVFSSLNLQAQGYLAVTQD